MKEEKVSIWRVMGTLAALFGIVMLMYVGGTPVQREDVASDQANIVLALATVKEGDILTFTDGHRCRVLEDRTPGNLMIRYACADEPQAIISTEAGPLAAQLRAVSPPVNEASEAVRGLAWEWKPKTGQSSEIR